MTRATLRQDRDLDPESGRCHSKHARAANGRVPEVGVGPFNSTDFPEAAPSNGLPRAATSRDVF
jgi:hypothetical protein